jgi:cbb3-type cytochrome oxidase maturation protein
MESLYILIPISLAFVFIIGWVFWRALEGGQFDDLERPAFDVLNDDDRAQDNRGQTPVDKSATVLDQPSTKNDLSTGV